MRVLNIFGGPGSGKTTSACALFSEMKMQGYSVEYVSEYAKQVVYADQGDWLYKAKDYQVTLTANQLHRLWLLRNHVDFNNGQPPDITCILRGPRMGLLF